MYKHFRSKPTDLYVHNNSDKFSVPENHYYPYQESLYIDYELLSIHSLWCILCITCSVVWSLLANGTVIAWNPFTREKINSVSHEYDS